MLIEEMGIDNLIIIKKTKEMQFVQFGEDSHDETQPRHRLSEIHLKLKPCRFIADLNQKQTVCYPNIDEENIIAKINQNPQIQSLGQTPIRLDIPLGKIKSLNENELKRNTSENLDPEKPNQRAKPSHRKRITIQKKLSEHAPLNGPGVIKLKDGKVVFESWKDGQAIGLVKIMYPSGNLYIGEVKNYIRSGKGLFCYKNGYKYDGDFVNGKFEGYGVMTNEYGDVVSKGVWNNGTLVQSTI